MNISQIPKDYRIYPFYKGKYIGHVIEGYASINTAKQKLKNSLVYETPVEQAIITEYFGNNYNYQRSNTIFYKLGNTKCYIKGNHQDGVYNIGDNIHVDDLNMTDEEYNEIIKDIDNIRVIGDNDPLKKLAKYYEFQKKYNLYPYYNIDYANYYKVREEFINNKIEYREGKLDISVHWKDTDTVDKF